mmetsp:Transcript_8857/g.16286  ORF Transcript_8857/g.16286 Transcript_8857/m.16286 type:complete len:80 (+) Transcript_8857:221-460(+)
MLFDHEGYESKKENDQKANISHALIDMFFSGDIAAIERDHEALGYDSKEEHGRNKQNPAFACTFVNVSKVHREKAQQCS